MSPTQRFPRHLVPRCERALADTPALVLVGARQTGKSTLAHELVGRGWSATYVTLDAVAARSAAQTDPEGFLAGFEGSVVIDEVQRAPALFPAIKREIDADRRPGKYLLTGSANVLLLPAISESLAGRSEVVTLWPLSQGELALRPEQFVDLVFGAKLRVAGEPRGPRRALLRQALRGGFPEALVRADAGRRGAWFDAYVDTVLQRDVRELARIEGLTQLPRLLALLAGRAMSVLNTAELSRVLAFPMKTLGRYLTLLERLFLVVRVPAWAGGATRRLLRHPKIALCDTGLLAHLAGVTMDTLERDATLSGPLLENLVVMELLKQSGFSASRPSVFHFRSHDGHEVDAVLERRDGTLVGIEVKASATVTAGDFKGLKVLAAEAGARFRRGLVLHTGSDAVAFDKNLHALPLSALWRL